jgi:NAD(P)-dependent dehydrogenase (short-subunit alcohol dehydrogenase family)
MVDTPCDVRPGRRPLQQRRDHARGRSFGRGHPVEAWDQVMAVNVRGVYLACKYAIPRMVERHSGSIINVSSFVAILGCSVPQDAYTASKGAVLALTRSLAVQFAPQGVRANAILPGPVETPLLMEWLLKDEAAKKLRLAETPPAASASPTRSSPWRSISPPTSRPGRTAPRSSSTAASASTTSDGRRRWPMELQAGRPGDRDRLRRQRHQGRRRRHATGQFVGDRIRIPTPQPSCRARSSRSWTRSWPGCSTADRRRRRSARGRRRRDSAGGSRHSGSALAAGRF